MNTTASDERNAFRAGYRHGIDKGIVSPKEAEQIMRSLPNPLPIFGNTITCFCEGAEDGANGDDWRYRRTWWIAGQTNRSRTFSRA